MKKKRIPRPLQTWLPKTVKTDIEIMGYFFSNKLAAGTFDAIDSNTVAYLLNVCHKLAKDHRHAETLERCDKTIAAYLGIRKRHDRTGKYGATGEELSTLREHMPDIAEYFATRPQHHIEAARIYVLRVNEKMRESGVVYADVSKEGAFENCEAMHNAKLTGVPPTDATKE